MGRPASTTREDLWWPWAAVVAGVVGPAGVIAAEGSAARLEVAALTAVTVAGILANTWWPGMPPALLAGWTFSPAVVLNLRTRGEGTMFLLVVSLSFFVLVTPDRRTRLVAGVVAVRAPPVVQAICRQDWGWPFWMMGIGFGWLSSEDPRERSTWGPAAPIS